MNDLIIFVIVVGIIVLIIKLDNKKSENTNLKVELEKEKIKQTNKYSKYKQMDFYAIYSLKENLLRECKRSKRIADEHNRSVWDNEKFIEKYALLDLLNDIAGDKFDSDVHNDDIYDFSINLDD